MYFFVSGLRRLNNFVFILASEFSHLSFYDRYSKQHTINITIKADEIRENIHTKN